MTDEMTVEEQNIWAKERRDHLRAESSSESRRARAADVARLDKLQAFAELMDCGWIIGERLIPVMKTSLAKTWQPDHKTIREAIDAMPEIPDEES